MKKRAPKTKRFMVTVAVVVVVVSGVSSSRLSAMFCGGISMEIAATGSGRFVGKIIHFDCPAMRFVKANPWQQTRPELEERLDYLSINYRLWFVCRGAAHCRTDTSSTICTALWLISSHSHFFKEGGVGASLNTDKFP